MGEGVRVKRGGRNGVRVGVHVGEGDQVGLGVTLGVGEAVGVRLGEGVGVAEGVRVALGVALGVALCGARVVGGTVGVRLGVGVRVGGGAVRVAVGVAVGVALGGGGVWLMAASTLPSPGSSGRVGVGVNDNVASVGDAGSGTALVSPPGASVGGISPPEDAPLSEKVWSKSSPRPPSDPCGWLLTVNCSAPASLVRTLTLCWPV